MTQICTYELAAREKRALQNTLLPLQKAVDKLADEIENSEK
ncbi:MAG TPA: hypothetical protein VKA95_05465 [Nitrososphaeraceae archaeon]|nr:hypothetical protein [Nitrososphaeraceae archaeon]